MLNKRIVHRSVSSSCQLVCRFRVEKCGLSSISPQGHVRHENLLFSRSSCTRSLPGKIGPEHRGALSDSSVSTSRRVSLNQRDPRESRSRVCCESSFSSSGGTLVSAIGFPRAGNIIDAQLPCPGTLIATTLPIRRPIWFSLDPSHRPPRPIDPINNN